MYALVDCNNFYVSCERLFNPVLEGKPVIVLSNNDGCAISRSDEAKEIGIAMGTPAFMISSLIKKHDIKVFSSNYTLYSDMSKRVFSNLAAFVPKLEIYSIDEAFLDFSQMQHLNFPKYAEGIKATVIQNTGIPVSIGMAPSKTLAKIANRLSKKKFKEIGVYVIDSELKRIEALKATEVGDIWGVGGQHQKKLKLKGINSAYDFSMLPDEYVRKEMSVIGLRTLQELRGIPSIEWTIDTPPKKGICTSRSFGKLCKDFRVLSEAVANFAANCAAKLRQQKTCCKEIHLFIQTNTHRTELKQCYRSINLQLPVASNNSSVIIKTALFGLNIIYADGYYFMKAGVIVSHLTPETVLQGGLFAQADSKKSNLVMHTLDNINAKFGKDMVRLSCQGYQRDWKLKSEKLSGRFTTNFNEIPVIKL